MNMPGWWTRLFRRRRLVAASDSDKGPFRNENQDAALADPQSGFFLVADGIGGGMEGGTASRMAVDRVRAAMLKSDGLSLTDRAELLSQALKDAHDDILGYARQKNHRLMGTTAVALVVDPENPATAVYCSAGDSRLYRIRDGVATQLTHDHTVAAEIAAMTGAARGQKGGSHPFSHVLVRSLGSRDALRLEWGRTRLDRGDRLLLCSDGVHGVVTDEEIGKLASQGDVGAAVGALMAAVGERGAPDNYTVVMAEVRAG